MWPPGERVTASLAMLSSNPFRSRSGSNVTKEELAMELAGVTIDFLSFVRAAQVDGDDTNVGVGSNPLAAIDDTTLMEIGGAVRGHCADVTDFYGYNLEAEFLRRLRSPENHHLYSGYALALCNSKKGFSDAQVERLADIKRCPTCPFYVAEVSMSLLASSCMSANAASQAYQSPRVVRRRNRLRRIRTELVRRLEAAEKSLTRGGFGGFIPTAMAVQALVRTETDLVDQRFLDRNMQKLMSYQKDDGSFGSTIGHTALAIPALTGQTAADLQDSLICPEKSRLRSSPVKDSTHTVHIAIHDKIYSKQVFRFSYQVKHKTNFIRGLSGFARKNQSTFEFVLRRSPGGPIIYRVNGLEGVPGSRWKVYILSSNSKTLLSDLRAYSVEKDTRFELALEYD